MSQETISDHLAKRLGLTKTTDKSFYKEVDWPYMYNWCEILVINSNFISITVGKKDTDTRKSILSMCYLKDETEFIFIVSRLCFLGKLFPEIVSVPQSDIVI